MLLIVGLTKSVMVTVISGRKKSCILNESSFSLFFTLDKNFVLVWNVLQGVVQGDFSWPVKTRIQCSPENNHQYGIVNKILWGERWHHMKWAK